MPTPITTHAKSFSFDIADRQYATTRELSRIASATYNGPDRVWVFIDEDTKLYNTQYAPLTSLEDGDSVPCPVGTIKVEVIADSNPVVISMLKEDCVTYDDVSIVEETKPDGSKDTYNVVATLSQTYTIDNLTYDTENNTWNLGEFIPAPVSWDEIKAVRNNMLTASDGKISPDMPEAVKQPWLDYRKALRDLTVTYGYGTDSEIEAWKVNFPEQPE